MSTIDERWNIVNTTRAFCQKVLPLVYDESLSYMELVCKVSSKLNEVIENNNNLPLYVKDLIKETVNSDEFAQIVGSVMMDTIINVKFPPEGITPAKGDGITDDTSSIQACLNYANSHGGAVVFFPSGKYLTGTLNVNTETSILGADRYNTSLVLKGGGNTPLLQGAINQSVRNISLDGNRLNQVEENYLIDGTIDMALFDNVILCDSAHCITSDTCNNSEFCNVLCKDIGDEVFITANGNNNLLTNINTLYRIDLTGINNNWQSPSQYKIAAQNDIEYQTPQPLNNFFDFITMQDDKNNQYKVLVDKNVEQLSVDEFINVKNADVYGLTSVIGDGVADDTVAFQKILTYAGNNNKAVLIPYGTNVYLANNVTQSNIYYLEFRGIVTLSDTAVLQIGANSQNVNPAKYNIFSVTGGKFRLVGLKNAIVTINDCTNLELYADGSNAAIGSLAYSTFLLGDIDNFTVNNINDGWVNENTFIKGRLRKITFDGSYPNNHNIFYNPVIEDSIININSGSYNHFLNCRLEGINNITFGTNTIDNKIEKTWYSSGLGGLFNGVPSSTGGTIVDNGKHNQVITAQRENAKITNLCTITSDNVTDYVPDAQVTGHDITIAQTKTIDLGLHKILKKALVLEFTSNATIWRIGVMPLDANFNEFTSAPANVPGIGWSTNQYYSTKNQQNQKLAFDFSGTNVAYVRITVQNREVAPFNNFICTIAELKDELV